MEMPLENQVANAMVEAARRTLEPMELEDSERDATLMTASAVVTAGLIEMLPAERKGTAVYFFVTMLQDYLGWNGDEENDSDEESDEKE